MANKDLRDWISGVDAAGELKIIKGVEPREEIGGFVDIYQRKMGNPALMFDEVPGFPKGHRIIANILTSVPRINLALGLPPQASEMELIQWWRNYFKNAPSHKPTPVNGGPLLDNVLEGKASTFKDSDAGLARARRRPVHWHGVYRRDEGSGFWVGQLWLLSYAVPGIGRGYRHDVSRQARPYHHGQISRAETALPGGGHCRHASCDGHASWNRNSIRKERN